MHVKEICDFIARLIFNLVVRLLGLAFIYHGLASVPTAIASFCPVFPNFIWRNFLPSFIFVVWPLLAGYWLLRGAPWLMRLAFPEEIRPGEPELAQREQ